MKTKIAREEIEALVKTTLDKIGITNDKLDDIDAAKMLFLAHIMSVLSVGIKELKLSFDDVTTIVLAAIEAQKQLENKAVDMAQDLFKQIRNN